MRLEERRAQDVVEIVESVLELAKAGKLRSVAIWAVRTDEGTQCAWGHWNGPAEREVAIGALMRLVHDMLNAVEEV